MSSTSPSPSELAKVGGYLTTLGGAIIAGSEAVLPDTSIGSPRSIGVSIGAVLMAVGGYLVARGH